MHSRQMTNHLSPINIIYICQHVLLQPLVLDPVFFPFTRPVLYGKQEENYFKVFSIKMLTIIRKLNDSGYYSST
jgi:hypothetical protein